MDPNNEIEQNFAPFFCLYKNGRVHRYMGTSIVPPSSDPASNVFSKDVTINSETGLAARLYIPKLNDSTSKFPLLVYYHGGGFCIESAFSPSYHKFSNSLLEKAPIVVVSVNYRLAPEHKLPVAYDDSWEALQWVMSRGDSCLEKYGDFEKVFIAGDSAGANIAHEMGMRAVEMNIEGMMLIHPFFASEAADPGEKAKREVFWKAISSTEVDDPARNPMINGGKGTMEVACKRVMVCVAEKDFLADRGVEYYETLKGSQWEGELTFVSTEGEGHVFHLRQPASDNAAELIDKLVAFIHKRPGCHRWRNTSVN